MPYFSLVRNIEISTFEYLQTTINASWSGITCVKSFKDAYAEKMPVVCIRNKDDNPVPLEIGDTTLIHKTNIIIDIFAKSEGQRIDLAYFITEALKGTWTYNEYSHTSGSETLNKIANGNIRKLNFEENTKIDFYGEDIDPYDKYRHSIIVRVEKV
jgi:hypothetical protein